MKEANKASCTHSGAALQAKDFALVDLHLHLDGSLSLASVRELAAMEKISLPERDEELLPLFRVGPDCRDLNEYLEKFAFTTSLMQTKETLSKSVSNLMEELKEQGLLYAEIRFAPQLHLQKGLTQKEVIEAAIEGLHRSDFKAGLILCAMRGEDNFQANLETVRLAADYLGKGVVAVDLAGAEALFPTKNFKELFSLAAELGIPYTIHAGEADGAESIRSALSFGTKRLGHGIRSHEDPVLMKELAEKHITLELCPSSNLHTNIFPSIEVYPLRRLLDAGMALTLNTDNMAVSGVTLQSEYQQVMDAHCLTREELVQLAQNAAKASFADAETKKWLLGELENRFFAMAT